ncbi:MAG: DUF4340 domain-containing protein [Ignavibacteriales bacterium]|nr:DUF4340 domain-containing protein [Ignavibacteriales bacterium]
MKQNSLLIGLLAVLLVVAYIVLQKPGEQSLSDERTGTLVEIDSLKVDRIEIKTNTLDLTLEKKGVDWFVSKPLQSRADQNNVANLIHQSKNLGVKSIVSTNPEKHSLFTVDSTGTTVKMYESGAERVAFIVGKPSSSFSETYVRKVQSNDVALVGGGLGYIYNRALREWRDKNIAAVPQENIREVKYQYGDTTFILAFKDSVWMIGRDSTDASSVQALLRNLSTVLADDFIDTLLTPQPKISAQISYNDIQLRFAFSKPAGKYFVQSSASPQWFVMEQWRAQQLLKRKKELVKARS